MKLISYLNLLVCFLVIGVQAHSSSLRHDASSEEYRQAVEHNRTYRMRAGSHARIKSGYGPVTDTASFSYVLLSGGNGGVQEVEDFHQILATNLPQDLKLVVLAHTYEAEAVRKHFSQWISSDRLIMAVDSDSNVDNGFWARDSFPIPVTNYRTGQTDLIAAKYYRPFQSWKAIADSVKSTFSKEGFTFVGGNLLGDEDGQCFSVNSSRLFGLRESDLKTAYGCSSVQLLKYLAGIGDVDEVLKPLPGKNILTNQEEYRPILEKLGYKVIMLPEPGGYGTYANSLILGQTVFMPVYGVSTDRQATQVYKDLGYRVIPVKSHFMSNAMHGSVHCETMAYPETKLSKLLDTLDAKIYEASNYEPIQQQ